MISFGVSNLTKFGTGKIGLFSKKIETIFSQTKERLKSKIVNFSNTSLHLQ